MNMRNIKTTIRENFIFYLAGFLIIFGMKYFYSKADCHMLRWILAPTARWVSILSRIPFHYESGTGYVNHSFRFIIAPSCSGVSFMIITTATLIFSFVRCFNSPSKKIAWMTGSICLSYLFTVFVNGLRIILAIYIPFFLLRIGIFSISPDRLHTLIGTAVYFTALLTIYQLVSSFFQKTAPLSPEQKLFPILRKCTPPLFWYFFMVLGIPFLNRVYQNNYTGFKEYAMLITIVCLAVLFLVLVIFMIKKFFDRSKTAR